MAARGTVCHDHRDENGSWTLAHRNPDRSDRQAHEKFRAKSDRLLVAIIGFIWTNLKEPVKAALQILRHLRLTPEARDRIRLRQLCAQRLRSRLAQLDEEELWTERRFAELEAEYYVGLEDTSSRWWRAVLPVWVGPRRRKALSRALATGKDHVALLEGDPGSGKSVVLRKVAADVCARAASSWKEAAPVAVYLNLKGLDRPPDTPVDERLIRDFVRQHLKMGTELERFIKDELEGGASRGRWLFLFDSFDEIPEVLNAEDTSD
jgi:hypothetical protein